MLFRKKMEPLCCCCKYGERINEESVICPKRGVVSSWQSCRHFSYDPLKREPEPQLSPKLDIDENAFEDMSGENFSGENSSEG